MNNKDRQQLGAVKTEYDKVTTDLRLVYRKMYEVWSGELRFFEKIKASKKLQLKADALQAHLAAATTELFKLLA